MQLQAMAVAISIPMQLEHKATLGSALVRKGLCSQMRVLIRCVSCSASV